MKIRRRCKCGCGGITNPGRKYIHGHNSFGLKRSDETRKKNSLAAMGNTNWLGRKHSKESKIKNSLSNIKYDPDYEYCDSWKDGEYRNDLRRNYCENIGCKGITNKLNNHHIDLNKKNCHPSNVMTLCASCHAILHNRLRDGKQIVVEPKEFLIINRPDHISYINKKTRKRITIKLKGGKYGKFKK